MLVKEHAVLMYGPDYLFNVAHGTGAPPFFTATLKDDPKSPHTTPTCVPDAVLMNMQPVMQIRHPGLMFPSLARAANDVGMGDGPLDTRSNVFFTLAYSRRLYEWYARTPGAPTPKVISADDIMNRPDVVQELCRETGMDPAEVQYEWETREAPEGREDMKRFASTIFASKGILPGYDSKGFDLEEKTKKWKEEFGDEAGESLARRVKDAMADYEWLMEKRVRVKDEKQ